MRRKKTDSSSLSIAMAFGIAVIVLIAISLGVKLVDMIGSSTFDGVHRYNLYISQESSLVSFSPAQKSITIVKIGLNSQSLKKLPKEVGNYLKVPVDGYIVNSGKNTSFMEESNGRGISMLIGSLFTSSDRKTNLTFFDFARLWAYSAKVPSHRIFKRQIEPSWDEAEIDKFSSSMLIDSDIAEEKVSVSIVNGTDMPGLGGRLERLLSNIGVNVVEVTNAQAPVATSSIVYVADHDSYTLSKIKQVLGFQTKRSETQVISDIIIQLGKDAVKKQEF